MRCYRCERSDLTELDFPKGNNRCRKCHKEYQAERRAKLAEAFVPDRTGTKVCSTCHTEKDKTEFGVAKGLKDGLQTQCNECRQESRKLYNTNTRGHIQNMVSAARRREWHSEKGFDISTDFLVSMWQAQNGCCALSGVPFVLDNETVGSRNPHGPSIDRIDANKGYTTDNVRLVTTVINLGLGHWGESILTELAVSTAKHHGYSITPPTTQPLLHKIPGTFNINPST